MASLRPLSGSSAEIVPLLAGWLEADDPESLVVETSGSTGGPKRVVLSRDAVVASATAAHERLGGPGRWTLLLPPTYVAGLQVVVRSLLAGTTPGRALGEGRYLSVVPTQLHRMLADHGERAALSGYDAILVGGAALDRRLRAEAGHLPLVTTYGMSETAGGCVYDGVPLDGVRVRIDDDGLVQLAGPVLFDGYEGDPVLTADVLRDGWFVTADHGEVDDDGRLRVLGRVDDVVNSGGVKVPAAAVARRLREHPGVQAAEVLGVPDPEWGERVVAVLVGEADLAELREWVAQVHPREWAPREVRVVEELPLLGNGKVDRQALRT